MIQQKYFLDPICGYGNSANIYIEHRLPEIINEFDSKEEAIKYIYENEIYMFNYINDVDTLEAKLMLEKYNVYNTNIYHINWKENSNLNEYFKLIKKKLIDINFKNIDNNGNPKFDFIIQNPPCNKSFHLKFLEEGLNMLSNTGIMTIIEPSTWLINLRKRGEAKTYSKIKDKIENHIKSITIEHLNHEIGINSYIPSSITTIDFSKEYSTFDFYCCGEHKIVNTIYDCNLIGNYDLIWSILNKCIQYNDLMNNHYINGVTFDKSKNNIESNKDIKYLRFSNVMTNTWYNNGNFYTPYKYGHIFNMYFCGAIHYKDHTIYDSIPKTKKGNTSFCIYGTKQELENWKYFVLNNSLPLFINIIMTIDIHDNSKQFIPWLVDKRRSDKEIYNLLKFTDEEIELIENTLKKYSRSSEWFKRYMEGPNYKKYCKNFEK